MAYKHIIFDLDGTLIDTEKAVLKTWQSTLKEYGYDFTLEELNVVLGITNQYALDKLNAIVDDKFEDRWLINHINDVGSMSYFDGVKEMLLLLKEKEFHLGIVTSRPKSEYDGVFRSFNLEKIFDFIILEDDTSKHKPNPEPIYEYVKRANAKLDECIYIGDMPTDILCAKNAGISSGLITWNNSKISIQEVDYIFKSPNEILDLVI